MPKYLFLVAVNDDGTHAALCEGGVYSNKPEGEYAGNTLDAAHAEAAKLNGFCHGTRYQVRQSMSGVDASDADVLASLEPWQIEIVRGNWASAETQAAIVRDTVRRNIEIVTAPAFAVLDSRDGTLEHVYDSAAMAQHSAKAHSEVWHKPEGQRPYQLDAHRLQCLVDMDRGQAIMLGGDAPANMIALANAIRPRGDDWRASDDLTLSLGRIVREMEAKAEHSRSRDEMENRYRAASLECNALQKRVRELEERNDAQGVTINTYREQRDSEGKRAVAAEERNAVQAAILVKQTARIEALELGACAVAGALEPIVEEIGRLPYGCEEARPLGRLYLDHSAMLIAWIAEAI